MQIKLLKEIVEHIAGRSATDIIDILVDKKNVNEFLIAKKLDLTVNQVRNLLYKLSNFGLVSFTRKKDKRKGWYIYFWTLNTLKSLTLLEEKLSQEEERLKSQLKNRKIKRFYICKTCNTEINEEHALLNSFTCQECGQVYELAENEKIISGLTKEVSKLEKQLEILREEKGKVTEKIRKSMPRDVKKTKKKTKSKTGKKIMKKKTGKKVNKKNKKSKKPGKSSKKSPKKTKKIKKKSKKRQ